MSDLRNFIADGSIIAVITGAVGALARWFTEVMKGEKKFVWFHFPMLLTVGAFLGHMGNELSLALGLQTWASLFAGASGAMGAYGFDFYTHIYTRIVEKVTGTKTDDKSDTK